MPHGTPTQQPPGAPSGSHDGGRAFRSASTWLNASIIGIQFPVAIAIGYFFGRFLDRHLDTWPWLTIVFSLFGIIAGFVNLFRITAQAGRAEAQLDKTEAAEDAREDDRPTTP
jgi:ATP synthase protein I